MSKCRLPADSSRRIGQYTMLSHVLSATFPVPRFKTAPLFLAFCVDLLGCTQTLFLPCVHKLNTKMHELQNNVKLVASA